VSELLPKLIWFMDEPIADSAFVTTYLVSRLAAESVKVILSGVGGDELFGGYRRYLSDRFMPYYNLLPPTVRKKWLPALLAGTAQDRHSKWENYCRLANAFVRSADLPSAQRYTSYVTLFSPEVRSILLKNGGSRENGGNGGTLAHYFDKCRDRDGLNRIIYVDLKTSLPDDLLLLTDKMTMAASLECRAPFIDHELVELASHIPSSLKVHGFSMKYLLKKAVEPWLPKEILRRKKRGFGAPMGAWLRDDLSSLVRDTLSESQVRKRGLLDWPIIEDTIKRHDERRSDETDSLLALVNLELWCRIFLDSKDSHYRQSDCHAATHH
jgi:asparagine synthase (glutamine-hydrolysing)